MAALNARNAGRTTAGELATAFDRSFAVARAAERAPATDFLAIRLDGRAHAVRLSEIAGLHVFAAATQLPSRITELRGITGIRGSILPVYDLAGLIGLPPARTLRWFVVAHQELVALAVEEFEGHFRAPVDAVIASENAGADPLRSRVLSDGAMLPLIHLPTVVAAIRDRCRAGHSSRNP